MICILIKDHDEKHHDEHKDSHVPSVAEQIMESEGFKSYVSKHGYHFSERLSEYASSLMDNADGSDHKWTAAQVRNALVDLGTTDFNKSTLGDLTYLANMAYADFYPEVIGNETACIKYAYAVAHDKDGYDGIAFSRWLSDIVGKKITDIKWENYV